MLPTVAVDISDSTQIALARRTASDMASELGFDEHDAGRVALLASEAASNIIKHAGQGQILLTPSFVHGPELSLLALDRGPGFDTVHGLRDGYSTAGTLGGGLGAMQRMSSLFELYTRPGRGCVIRLVLRRSGDPAPVPTAFDVGAVAVPYPGESVCGDAWYHHAHGGAALLVVADGLGHGLEARRASGLATAPALAAREGGFCRQPQDVISGAHAALRPTRGAAMAVALLDPDQRTLHYAGIGNISGVVIRGDGQKHLLSLAGIVGHNIRKIQPVTHPWDEESVLVMCSDGLSTHWNAADDPELIHQPASIIAAVLYRDHQRGRDDATVVVIKNPAPPRTERPLP